MHRSYQPLKPSTNKYLQKKWDQTRYEQHRNEVNNARPMVDTKVFQTPAHILLKMKKHQLEGERLAVIDRDNQLLSSKLADIMCSKGLVDNWNNYPERSLNAAKRREELQLVTRQNQALLQRIRACESEYRRQVWEESWEKAECRRDGCTHYPRGIASQQRPRRRVTFEGKEKESVSKESTQRESSATYSNHEDHSQLKA